MKTIFILMACQEYECSCMAKAFANKSDADAACREANDYIETKPQCPNVSTDEEYDAWDLANQEWANKHPAGSGHEYADSFTVRQLELVGG